MGLTGAMYTGLTGLNTNQFRIDTAGDNIANINTTAFKSNRANFQNLMSITMSEGSGPGAVLGGSNPLQIGMGSMLGSVQKNFTNGSIEPTGIPTDMAIQGDGFFVLKSSNAGYVYTRDGTFHLDANHMLVNGNGLRVQGYGVDSGHTIIPGVLTDLNIPLGQISEAKATTNVEMTGLLNPNGAAATQGTILSSAPFKFEGAGGVATAATGSTKLIDLRQVDSKTGDITGVSMFNVGDVISLPHVKIGGRDIPDNAPNTTFTVTDSSTMDDYMLFLQNAIGINTDPAVAGTGNPGVRISADGEIIIEGNKGTQNAIDIGPTAITTTDASGTQKNNTTFGFESQQVADGQSAHTSFIVYDSLGTPVQVEMTFVLESKGTGSTTWRYYAQSRDSTDANPVVGTGVITFDSDGQLQNVNNNMLNIPRINQGAVAPVQFTMDFSKVNSLTTTIGPDISMSIQDGHPTGKLYSFSVGEDGTIMGIYDNGETKTLGQVAMAKFANSEGLVVQAGNLYVPGPNSGPAVITTPGALGTGKLIGGALELSNVDLTRELISLITASTGFSAAGRVITTANDLLNQLMTIAR